jgi:hypothetical protein
VTLPGCKAVAWEHIPGDRAIDPQRSRPTEIGRLVTAERTEPWPELQKAADEILQGRDDLFLRQFTIALERAYRDQPANPVAQILLPAYRSRLANLNADG